MTSGRDTAESIVITAVVRRISLTTSMALYARSTISRMTRFGPSKAMENSCLRGADGECMMKEHGEKHRSVENEDELAAYLGG